MDEVAVENNIHYPTDSSLLGDGVRVLTRIMRKITQLTGQVGAKLRDRGRSVGLRLLEIARAARGKASAASGQDEARLWQTAERDRPGGGTGETLLKGDRHWREAQYHSWARWPLASAAQASRRAQYVSRSGGHWPWRRPQASGSYSEP